MTTYLSLPLPLPLLEMALLLVGMAAPAQGCTSTVSGTTPNDHFGWSLVCIGDVDADGANDLAVGAPQAGNPSNAGGRFGPGYVKVISGRTGGVLRTIQAPAGTSSRGMFGFSLAAFVDGDGDGLPDQSGDVDGDNVPDFLIGAPTFDGANSQQGIVYVVSGATGATTPVANPNLPITATENFGWSISALGRRNGNPRPAFAVGAPGAALGSSGNRGRVDAFDWPAVGATPARYSALVGTQTGQFFGIRVLGIGRASGNADPDLLVASTDTNGLGQRTVEMLAANTLTLRHRFVGNFPGYGASLGGLGDLNGDGRPDFAIGGNECAACASNRDELATIYSWPSTSSAPVPLEHLQRPRFQMTTALGVDRSLAAAGDVDGDGIGDLLVGVPLADPVGTASTRANAGEVRIYSGATLGSGAPYLLAAFDGVAKEGLGATAVGLGDVDADAAPDLAFAAPFAANNVGRVVVHCFARRAQQYGLGCNLPSASAPPELHVTADAGPCLGGTLAMHTTQFLPNQGCWFGLGLAPANVPGVPHVGCTLLVRIDVSVFLISGPDTFASLALSIPNVASLHGTDVYVQSAVFDDAQLSFGLAGMSQGLRLSL